MPTKVIFSTDKKLKEAAMKKAREEGLTYSAFLNIATRAYVNDNIKIHAFERDLERALGEMRQGRGVPAARVYKKLGLRKK